MYKQINLLLTTHEDSPEITQDDVDSIIAFCREELEATGKFRSDAWEEVVLDRETGECLE